MGDGVKILREVFIFIIYGFEEVVAFSQILSGIRKLYRVRMFVHLIATLMPQVVRVLHHVAQPPHHMFEGVEELGGLMRREFIDTNETWQGVHDTRPQVGEFQFPCIFGLFILDVANYFIAQQL
jgi:hypothetical protein